MYMTTSRTKYAIPRQVGLSYTKSGKASMTGLRVVDTAALSPARAPSVSEVDCVNETPLI